MTVEEILVKFTGDASSLTGASDKAKNKTKDMREEVEKLDRIMARAKVGTSGYEMTLAKLEQTARKYSATLERINQQEKKAGSSPLTAGGYGGGGGGRLGIKGAFAAGAGVASVTTVSQYVGNIVKPVVEKAALGFVGEIHRLMTGRGENLNETFRKYDEEVNRSAILDQDRVRGASNRGLTEGRIAGQMINPETGEVQTDRQAQFWREKQDRTQAELESANRRVELTRQNLREKDTYGRHLPVLWHSQKMEYEDAQRAEKSALADVERLKGQRDAEMNRAADLEAGGDVFQRGAKKSQIAIAQAQQKMALLGLKRDAADAIRIEQIIEKEQNDSGKVAFLDSDTDARRKQLQDEFKAKKEVDEKEQQTSINDRLRDSRASRGFSGYEAEILKKRAQGDLVGIPELMQLGDEEAAATLKDSLMTPIERGMKEKERIDRIRGELDPETYQRAMAEIDKSMKGPGPAASRAATGYGSAEHSARMYAYNQVMTQPATQQANIDRLSKEPGKSGDKQSEANNYLRSIRDAIKGKKTVEVQPANLGGG